MLISINIKGLDKNHVRPLREIKEQKRATEKKIIIIAEEIITVETQIIDYDKVRTFSSIDVSIYYSNRLLTFEL